MDWESYASHLKREGPIMKPSSEVLAGSVAVVTGASRGIGLAIARRLIALSATVIITARDERRLEQARDELRSNRSNCEAVTCDVADLAATERLAAHVRRTYGRLNILVNNAGVAGPPVPLYELSPADWDRILNTNLRGVFYMVRSFVPLLIESGGGHIINISSLAGKNPLPRGAAYAGSKWGLNGLTYSMAEELRGHNIRASVVCPGSVNTEFSPSGSKDPAKKLTAEDVAHAVEMLVTQRAGSFISDISIRPTVKP
jgi:NAD(P)-dependent dehydrogenase (short-subunit alcohol dehydrogenase family)